MILSIFTALLGSGIPGFLISCVTTLIKGSEERKMKKFDIEYAQIANEHELNMLQESAKNQQQLQGMKLEELQMNLAASQDIAESKVDEERQKNLYVPVELASKLNSFIGSVRPVVTYSFTLVFLGMYVFLAFESVNNAPNIQDGLLKFLDTEFAKNMNYLFASIITFWFGNRMVDKNKSSK